MSNAKELLECEIKDGVCIRERDGLTCSQTRGRVKGWILLLKGSEAFIGDIERSVAKLLSSRIIMSRTYRTSHDLRRDILM
jgi:hypothetical protein